MSGIGMSLQMDYGWCQAIGQGNKVKLPGRVKVVDKTFSVQMQTNSKYLR